MTKTQATKEAREIADRDRIRMVVTYNPYAETEDEAEKYGYHPHRVAKAAIFAYDEIVKTIRPREIT
jgi:prolyl-tRNA editing enzyme YbaK/EbsC (Cys-tRNA(Pro) deacylase)